MRNAGPYPVVVFDGSCGFCKNILKLLCNKFDFSGVLFLPYSDKNAELWGFPPEIIAQHHRYIFYLSSSTEFHRGYFAFKQLFGMDRKLKMISYLMRFKVVEVVGRVIYTLISKNRRILSARSSSCGI